MTRKNINLPMVSTTGIDFDAGFPENSFHWLTFNPGLTDKDLKEILKLSCTNKNYASLVTANEKVAIAKNFHRTLSRNP